MKETTQQQNLQNLRREWIAYALAGGLFTAAWFAALYQAWPLRSALAWLVTAAALGVYLFADLWKRLGDNRPGEPANASLYPTLGLANGITISRAILITALAGFVFGPQGTGWLAWAPGLLYLAVVGMDFLDGYAARITRRTSVLGEALDMLWDSTGALAAVLVLVVYGQAPAIYLLMGAARYWYVFGVWLHRRRGLPIYDLPPSRFRRPLAGVQMGYIAAALLPVFGPPATWVAAVLFLIPHQAGFAHDFLWVTGRMKPSRSEGQPAPHAGRGLRTALVLVMRALLVGLLVNLALGQNESHGVSIEMLIIAGLGVPALLLGAAGRAAALGLLLLAGLNLQTAPQDWHYWLILLFSTVLFLTGTGRYSLWKPEDWLIDHRAGEA